MPIRDVVTRIAHRVSTAPEQVAVQSDGTSVSYARFWEMSADYAAWVRSRNMPPEGLVAVRMSRSPEAIAALLGVMRAGAVFVPIDPAWPAKRSNLLLDELGGPPVLEGTVAEAEFDEVVELRENDAAYAIFTSGSTGQPKAVVVEHGALAAFVDAMTAVLDITTADRVLQFASLSFDACMEEIFPTLCVGATIVLRDDDLPDPVQLAASLDRHAVTVLDLPTAYWHSLVAQDVHLPDCVRWVIIGGEAASASAVRRWLQGRPPATLINTYGPTECTVTATGGILTSGDADTVPIGTAVGSVRAYVLDEQMNPVSDNRPGWLYLGGPQVARGYRNAPARTAEVFVPDPWGPPGSRMYDTGDMAAVDEAGQLVFLGRRDAQVKIRGHRVELAEVLSVVAGHPEVDAAAVDARPDSGGALSVVAWVVGADTNAVRTWVADRLPAPMVPAVVKSIAALPLTSSGKVDMAALPSPFEAATAVGESAAEPSQELLATIWTSVLGVSCGLDDDFFDLGGHSLHATQVVSRVRNTFGVEISLRDVFEARTVRALTRKIVGARTGLLGRIPLTRNPRSSDERPVSVEQERLWFFERYQPNTSHYVIPAVAHIEGVVDVGRLQSAVDRVVERHEVLRSTFHERDGRPYARVASSLDVKVCVVTSTDETDVVATESGLPFDLEAGPLIRVTLVNQKTSGHVLIVAMHHIVCDGWSLGVLASEITAFYGRLDLAALPVAYADFADSQLQWIASEQSGQQLAYWRETLSAAPTLELPTDRPRPRVRSFTPQHIHFELDAHLSEALRVQATERGATVFMVVLAAFSVVLQRYSGAEDLVVGAPIAGRTSEELESLIGFFVNILLHRVDLSGSPTFGGLVERVRARALDAYANQDIPFETLVAELLTSRDPSRSPLAQVMLVVHNSPPGTLALDGCEQAVMDSVTNAVPVDMTVDITAAGDGYAGVVHYNGQLFDSDRITRFIGHLKSVLSDGLGRPDAPIESLRMLSPDEVKSLRAQAVSNLGGPVLESLQECFADSVAANPNSVAVTSGGQEITFGQLDTRSSALAGYLRNRGVRPNDLVGVCLERGIDMVVAMLGVIKSGAAYLPLDPNYPEQRLAFILSDAGAQVLVTQRDLAAFLPEVATSICIDADSNEIATSDPFVHSGGPQDTVYVIYTSGSTGRPKGIAVRHCGVVRLVRDTDYVQLTAHDTVAQVSNSSFDAATFEIWGPLLNGGRVAVVPTEVLLSASHLRSCISERGIDVMFVTTALFNQMSTEAPDMFSGMKALFVGGEAADPSRVRAVLEAGGPQSLVHVYGPTEATTFATWHEVTEVAADAQTVPIGRPIARTSLYLFDSMLRLVPVGVAGEIFLGGPGLASGYLHRPGLTAEKFVPNPCDPNTVLYRTGDLARMRSDGALEFLGRIDDQVKVRGFRIELAEVEAALSRHPAVGEAVVVVREDKPGDRKLAAFVAAPSSVVTGADLRRFVGHQLPAFMVPASVTVLDALPLTPNGKVDRKGMPTPVTTGSADDPPVTETERALAAIWAEVLDVKTVGLNDDFFDLGGHSLVATRVVSRVRDRLGVDLPLRTVFDASTLSRLAPIVEAEIAEGRTVKVEAISRRPR